MKVRACDLSSPHAPWSRRRRPSQQVDDPGGNRKKPEKPIEPIEQKCSSPEDRATSFDRNRNRRATYGHSGGGNLGQTARIARRRTNSPSAFRLGLKTAVTWKAIKAALQLRSAGGDHRKPFLLGSCILALRSCKAGLDRVPERQRHGIGL
jgi:hypothetical protein